MTKETIKPPKAKKTYIQKKKLGLTLYEFRAWISGVEEMQPNNWVPDAGQWKTIRSKFNDIVEGPAVVNRTINNNPFDQEPRSVRQAGPSGFVAPQPTMRAPSQPIELHNPNRPVETPNTMPDLNSGEGAKKMVGRVKTPNIDTSSGNYTAAFE